MIRHEAIDSFVDRDGKRVGMDPMSMPFPVAEGLSLAGLAPGDVVRCTLEVDWQQRSPVKIAAIEKLPAGTQLTFRAARP
jgi:Cu/Ag efflux protein CusF